MTSIRLEGIEKGFPGVKALVSINLTIEAGELFTLLGPSGCGKTTLLRTIAGFYRQDAGQVWLGDDGIANGPPSRRATGMVFQSYAIFPHMTVFENVAFGLRNRRVRGEELKSRVARALDMARLGGFEKRTPDQLSGGQQQRVGLARAMVIEPRVLLMDEPLSNLDAKLRVEMRTEIREIQKQLGITTVYVTHDQEEALVISDRIAVMSGGRIQQVGRPWEIYKTPVNRFVASFVGNTNTLVASVAPGSGGAVANVASHRIPLPHSPGADQVHLVFRPEELTLTAGERASTDGEVCLPGSIRSSTFTGSLASYVVECGDDVVLTVERHKPSAADILPTGTRATVGIPRASIFLFHPETGERL